MNGKLEKLEIYAFDAPEMSEGSHIGVFTTLVNPDNYALKYKVDYKEQQASGTSANMPEFDKIPPKEMNFEFLFDRTGAIPGAPANDTKGGVENDINDFKDVAFKFNGDIHRPNYLKIVWGTLIFKCYLTGLDVTYKLFQSDGTPLRATAKATFKEFKENQLRVNEEKKSSPDLTHVRTVKGGDTLPLMTYQIYGDSKYYIDIARINGILDFKQLSPGTKLFFPPLENVVS